MQNFGKPNIELPKTHLEGLDFSFSGIKTAVINLNHNKKDIKKEDLCASFEKTVTDMLIENTKKALKMHNINKVALAGGVSANSYIREKFIELGKEIGAKIYFPRIDLCTDNAAMIASSGYYNYLKRKPIRFKPKCSTKFKNRTRVICKNSIYRKE